LAFAEASVTPLLSADAVSFSYRGRLALDRVTLSLRPGEVVSLVGPNGAGKTTLLKVLAGLLAPQTGTVRAAERRKVAYLAQSEGLPSDWSVREVVELGRLPYVGLWRDLGAKDERAVRDAMDRVQITSLAGRPIATLSGGERQRVALARALAQEPSILLLDEPSAHLDLRHQADLLGLFRAEADRGVAVVVVMHDLTAAGQADRCVLLSNGRVRADGAPGDVLSRDLLRQVYETEVEVLHAQDGRIVIVHAAPGSSEGPPSGIKETTTWNPSESS
jgi:iron complex transport system ATP-binding protein